MALFNFRWFNIEALLGGGGGGWGVRLSRISLIFSLNIPCPVDSCGLYPFEASSISWNLFLFKYPVSR